MTDAKTQTKADDALTRYRQQFTDYVDNSQDEREEAELHRDFYDGKQWTAEEVTTLEARGQPVITDNKIKDKVEYMEGVERKTRTDPKAFPRTPTHEGDADVATDAIRFVFDRNRFPVIKSAVFQNLLVEGFGGAEVIVDKDDPRKIIIRKYRWDRLYRDPHSMEPDCSDAMYRGIITWMDAERAKEKWPGKEGVIGNTMTHAPTSKGGETHDDKPRWINAKRNRVQIFEHFNHERGTIMRSVFCWGGFLEDPTECPYLTDEDEHEDPMVLASAYVDREGKRYGLVQRYKSLQEELNKRRSKSLHLLNAKRLIAEKGAFDDIKEARKQMHLPDGVLEPTPGFKVEVQEHLDLSAAHFQLLQQAEASLSATGPNAALLGQSGSISGRAKELDQQGGALQIGVLFDAIRDWQLRIARAVWNRIRQYWDSEMWIRVTDDERGVKFVALNQPVLQGELMAQQLKGQPPEEIEAGIAMIAQDPRSREPVTGEDGKPQLRNAVAQLDVDIIIDEAPDVITLQAEEFGKIADLAATGKVPIPPDVLIEASQLRPQVKKRIIDKLSGVDDPMAKMQAQFAQMMQQLDGLLKQAQVRETNASADLKLAQAEKTQTDAVVSVVNASTPPAEPRERVAA